MMSFFFNQWGTNQSGKSSVLCKLFQCSLACLVLYSIAGFSAMQLGRDQRSVQYQSQVTFFSQGVQNPIAGSWQKECCLAVIFRLDLLLNTHLWMWLRNGFEDGFLKPEWYEANLAASFLWTISRFCFKSQKCNERAKTFWLQHQLGLTRINSAETLPGGSGGIKPKPAMRAWCGMEDGGVSWAFCRHQTLPLQFCLPEIKTWGAEGSECGREGLGVR